MGFVNDGPWANFETEAPDTLENGSVGTNQLVDLSVTTQKLANGSVTTGKLSSEFRLSNIRTFDTVATMQAATDLEAGMTCHTNGFHVAGDSGAAFYVVGTSGTANGMDVLALQDSMIATLIITESYVTPEMFGAYGDGTHDDADAIGRAASVANCIVGDLGKSYYVTKTASVSHALTVRCMNVVMAPIAPTSPMYAAFTCSEHRLTVVNCRFTSEATQIPYLNYINNNNNGLASNTIACSVSSGILVMIDCTIDSTSCAYATDGCEITMNGLIGKSVEMGLYCDGSGTYFSLDDVDFEMSGNTADTNYHFIYARDHGEGVINGCKCTLSDSYLISTSSVAWGNQMHAYHTSSAYQGEDAAREILVKNTIIDLSNVAEKTVQLGQCATARFTYMGCKVTAPNTGGCNLGITTGVRHPWFYDCVIVQNIESAVPFFTDITVPSDYEGDYLQGLVSGCDITLNNPSSGSNNILAKINDSALFLIEKCSIKTKGYVFYGNVTTFVVRDCIITFLDKVYLHFGSTRKCTYANCTLIAQGDINGTVTSTPVHANLLNCSLVGVLASAISTTVYGTATCIGSDLATVTSLNRMT